MLLATSATLTVLGLSVGQAAPALDLATHEWLRDSSPRPFELHRPEAHAGSLLMRGFEAGPYGGAPQQAARAFLGEHAEALGLPAVGLEVERVSSWRDRCRVHLRQQHGGLPVLGGQAVVTLDGAGRVVMLSTRLQPGIDVSVHPSVPEADAVAAALEVVAEAVKDESRVDLVVLPDARGGRLVWQIELWTVRLMGHQRVRVDAHSGAVLSNRDMRQQALAQVYERNAANSELVEVELHGVEAGDDTLTTSLAIATTVVFDDGSQDTEQLAIADEQGDFFYDPDDDEPVYDDPFAEVNAYWHVTDIKTWFEDNWGHEWEGPVTVITNYRDSDTSSYDNAYFTKDYIGKYQIALGQGTVDLAYDSDVVQHEFGHGIVDDLCDINAELDYPIAFDQYGMHAAAHAVNEGMADYWSSTYQGDPYTGEYFGSAFGMSELRNLDNDNKTPDDLLGEAHEDGLIVGGTFWAVRTAIGADAADDIIYGALGSLSSAPTFLDYATAVDEHAAVLLDSGELTQDDLDAIEAIFEERGWYKSARAIPLEPGDVEQGIFLGADLLAGYIGSSACDLARSFSGGLLFPLPFQFSFTVPEEPEVLAVNIDFGLAAYGIPAIVGEDDLEYGFYARQGEMVTFEEFTLDMFGMEYTLLSDVLDYDLEVDDQPESVRIEADDPDMPLVPGETYYFDLAGMNCPLMNFAISVDYEYADVDEEEDPKTCGCASGHAGVAGVGLLGFLGLGLALRRRR